MKLKNTYPANPFPYLFSNTIQSNSTFNPKSSPLLKQVWEELKSGANIVFDFAQKKIFLFKFQGGIKILRTITIRTLSLLVKSRCIILKEIDGARAIYVSA